MTMPDEQPGTQVREPLRFEPIKDCGLDPKRVTRKQIEAALPIFCREVVTYCTTDRRHEDIPFEVGIERDYGSGWSDIYIQYDKSHERNASPDRIRIANTYIGQVLGFLKAKAEDPNTVACNKIQSTYPNLAKDLNNIAREFAAKGDTRLLEGLSEIAQDPKYAGKGR